MYMAEGVKSRCIIRRWYRSHVQNYQRDFTPSAMWRVQPVPWMMRLEMVIIIGMQIEIIIGIKKLPFYGSFQIFN